MELTDSPQKRRALEKLTRFICVIVRAKISTKYNFFLIFPAASTSSRLACDLKCSLPSFRGQTMTPLQKECICQYVLKGRTEDRAFVYKYLDITANRVNKMLAHKKSGKPFHEQANGLLSLDDIAFTKIVIIMVRCICIHSCSTYMHVCMYACMMHVCIYACMMHVCMSVRMYAYIRRYILTSISLLNNGMHRQITSEKSFGSISRQCCACKTGALFF